MKRHTIIGTAGHIDHGKTALIKALTGIDADRLKEEKDRGITIDLGFAYWREDVTIIDVPGHEKFIRNMVAGVSTIDLFVLVIAADDGIMPQTIEHLEILNFFNIKNGIVVLNKSDLVDQEWLDLVTQEVAEMLDRYALSGIPMIPCSAETGENVDSVRQLIEDKIKDLEENISARPFRLLVDRSFSIKGFGTVVTGTVLSGLLHKGDDVMLMPAEQVLKVRGIQTHTSDVAEVAPGFRAAVNLQGISKEKIIRGDVLCEPASLMPVAEFTGIIKTVSKIPKAKIPNRTKIHAYVGTAECPGQLIWYEDDKYLREEKEYRVRVKLDRPLTAARSDAFLVRLHSPVITLAGGQILEVNPVKIRHQTGEWATYFEQLQNSDLASVTEAVILHHQLGAVSQQMLQQKFFEHKETVSQIISNLNKRKKIRPFKIKGQDYLIHEQVFDQLLAEIIDFIGKFHSQAPHKPGISQTELSNAMDKSWVRPEIFDAAIKKLLNSKQIRSEQNIIALADFKMQLSKDTDEIRNSILARLEQSGFMPPTVPELASELEVSEEDIRTIIAILVKEKLLIAIQKHFYLHQKNWQRLVQFLNSFFAQQAEMPVAALKDFIQTTRKYAIPLFEYLDAEGYTQRSGDVRQKGFKLEELS